MISTWTLPTIASTLFSWAMQLLKYGNVYALYLIYHNGCIYLFMSGSKLNHVNTSRPRQNGRRYPVDIFKCIFLNENICIPINISLKSVPKGQIYNIPSMVQIMAWRQPGDKPLFEPMMVNLVTHVCVTRPQWVNKVSPSSWGVRIPEAEKHLNAQCADSNKALQWKARCHIWKLATKALTCFRDCNW